MLPTNSYCNNNGQNEQCDYNRQIKRVAFVYLSLASSAVKRRVLEEKFMLRPKLGLGYLRAALKERSIESKIYDQVLMNFDAEKLMSFLKRDKIDLVGFYIISRNLKVAVHFILEVKNRTNIPVIAGGPGCDHYNELIDAGCEIVCLGEGDKTINDIVDYYERKKSQCEITGIAYRDAKTKKILVTLERALVDDLDDLPFPVRDFETIRKYCDHFAYPLKKPYISIMTSRGCPYRCAFCTSHSFWKGKYRQRSVENVIEEIKEAILEFRIKSVQFVDDIFAINFDWLREFCERIKKERIKLNWMCDLHPLSFRKTREKAFSIMKDAGCNIISFGAQSSDTNILKRINRDPNEPEELRKAIYQAKSLGITTILTYILGLPGETIETIQKNFDFCLEIKPHLLDFHPLEVIPFSELDIRYREEEISKLNNRELFQLSIKYMTKYYARPTVIFQFLKDVLCKNPYWLFSF